MHENYVSRATLVTALAWACAVLLILIAWVVVALSDHWRIAGLLAATGLCITGLAVTLQTRLYVIRLCSLIRMASGFEEPERHNRRDLVSVP